MKFKIYFRTFLLIIFSAGCSSYKANLMFNASQKRDGDWHKRTDFTIQSGDQIEITMSLWNGEPFVIQQENRAPIAINIAINEKGRAEIPLIGSVYIQGLSLVESDSLLKLKLSNYIKDPFITSRWLNKRAVIIGSLKTQVIPLQSNNIRLTEAIAMSGGLPPDGRSSNIRVLRGDQYFISNLSQAHNRPENDIYIRPDDVIYIEPVKKAFHESLRDSMPLISGLTSILSIVVVLLTIL